MSRQRARQLASEFLARADATGWFEALYAEAGNNYTVVPWADLAPNPNLVDWVAKQNLIGRDRAALCIGCGYGDDAEFLAQLGFQVVAFDISPTAISQCQQRFRDSPVNYRVADLLDPPDAWYESFSFILESYTLQVLPPQQRVAAIANIANLVAPSGQILVISRGREQSDPLGDIPYPLTRGELARFENLGLSCEAFEDYYDRESPPVRRFRILYAASNAV